MAQRKRNKPIQKQEEDVKEDFWKYMTIHLDKMKNPAPDHIYNFLDMNLTTLRGIINKI